MAGIRGNLNFDYGDALTLLAPFAVVKAGASSTTYFAFASANIFGLEDQLGGGDGDFDVFVVGLRSLAIS